jgi:PAS domain S-box-containing protein
MWNMVLDNSINLALFEKGPTVLFIWKNESGWPVESVSPNLLDIFGYLPERYISGELHYSDSIHPDDLQRVVNEVQKASSDISCDSIEHHPYRYLDGHGKYRWVKDSTRIIRSESGDITHYIGYLIDMTTEVELKEETELLKERLELAWSATNDGLWDWDISSGNVYFSDRWKAMIGYAPEEFPNDPSAFFESIHPEDQPNVQSLLQRHFADPVHTPYEIDIRMRTKEGTYKWIRTRGKTTLNPDATPHRMAGAHTDISDYKEGQLALEESEKRWRIAVDGSGDGLWDWNILKSEVYFSDRWKKMLGFEPDEIGNSLDEWAKRVHPDDLDEVYKDIQKCMSGETPTYRNKHRVLCKDGSYKWILDRGVIIEWTESHEPKRMVGTHTDIDESETNHLRIKLLQRRYASMFHDHSSIMLLIDPKTGKIIDTNKSAESFYGYSRQEFLALSTNDLNLLSPDEIEQHRREAIDKKENHFIFPHRLKNGEIRTVEVFSSPIETENGHLLYSIIRDVTKAKANETKLIDLNRQLTNLAQNVPGVVYTYQYFPDGTNTFPYASEHIYDIYGLTPDEVQSDASKVFARIHPDDISHVVQSITFSFETLTLWEDEYRVLHPRKGEIWVKGTANPTPQKDGSVLWYGYIFDVTERKNSEIEIENAKHYFQKLLEYAADGVQILDMNGNLIHYSNSFAQMLGYGIDEMKGMKIIDWEAGLTPDEITHALQNIQYSPIRFQTLFKHKCGSMLRVEVFARGIELEGEFYIYAAARDISAETKLKEEIIQERNFVSTIVNNANAIIAVIKADGTMSRINEYGQQFVGYTQEEIASEPYFWSRFLNARVREHVTEIIKKANQGEIVKTFQNTWIGRDGIEHMFEWSNTLVNKENGELDYIFTIGLDISENLKAQEKMIAKNIEFKSIFDLSRDGIAIVDLESRYLDFNQTYQDMTGFTREELLGLSCIDLTIPEDQQRSISIISKIIEQGIVDNFQKYCIRRDGSTIPIVMSGALLPDHKRILITAKDLSIQKAYERNLILAKEEAENALKVKSEFLSNMSHEIRTPLNGIIGLNTLLLKTPLNERQSDYIQKSLQSSKALLGVINDILDYSKIEAGKLELSTHPFSLENLLRSTTDLFEYTILEKNLEIHIDYDLAIPAQLEGDSLRISQILNNLVGNAVKFTERGDIIVRACLDKKTKEAITITFSITDTGIGMSPEELNKLFHSFSQTDASNTRKYGGTGLGLVITKQLVEMMGGKIWVESTKGEGSTFHCTITLQPSKHDKSLSSVPKQFKHNNFMVVEDNIIEREMIGQILNSWGIHPILCATGEEALERARSTHIDYLLVDWGLSGAEDGLDVIEKIHLNHSGTFPKVIMISALMREELTQKADQRNLHPDIILHKPITPSVLLEALIDQNELRTTSKKEIQTNTLSFQGHILLAEDNAVNQLVAQDLLDSFGLTVDIAANGAEAIEMSKNKHYDLILMDLQMPEVDGFEASRQIRTFNRSIPIIALSAAVMQRDKELTVEAGMNAHLAKPIDIQELQKVLSDYLKTSEKPREENEQRNHSLLNISGVNIEKLHDLFLNDAKILTLLKTFAITQKDFCDNLDKTPIGSEPYKKMIHSLKGVSGSITALKIYQLCIDIEESNDHTYSKRLISELCAELTALMSEIDRVVVLDSAPETTQSVTLSETLSLIDSTLAKLNSNQFITNEERNDLISMLQHHTDNTEMIKLIDKAIIVFDFKRASDLILTLKEQIHES